MFGGATFNGDTEFISATFNGDTDFSRATFIDAAWFGRATFHSDTWFSYVAFVGQTRFVATDFGSERIDFTAPRQWGPPSPEFDWDESGGGKPANIEPADWPPIAAES
ncbi:pentapeptide repeat-containing protein [Nocardia sp. NPDC004604]|uniref:pentapeptide repeat-containing protein n=1 Tax=Nocardia sp. NPDC004604 TaxID=3157013 RepID=UPI0033B76DD0